MKLLPISGLKYTVADKTGWTAKGVETQPNNRANAIIDNLVSTTDSDTALLCPVAGSIDFRCSAAFFSAPVLA